MTDDTGISAVNPGQAVKLYERILKSGEERWSHWKKLGEFVIERRYKAEKRAGSAAGTKYSAALKKELGAFAEIYKKLNGNGTLTGLIACMQNLEAIEAFRAKMPEDQRISHPQRMWQAFNGLSATKEDNDIEDDEIDDDEEDEDDGERKPRKKRTKKESAERERELLDRIAWLEEKLSEQVMTIDPDMNAQRLWRHLIDIVGHDAAADLALKTAHKLEAIVRRVTSKEDA